MTARDQLTGLLNAVVGIDYCAAREGAERLLRAGWLPPSPRRTGRPNHNCPPGTGRTVTPETGYFIGYIAELPDDSDGEQLMEFSGTVHRNEEAAREDLADAQGWRPGWHLYRLSDITERPSE